MLSSRAPRRSLAHSLAPKVVGQRNVLSNFLNHCGKKERKKKRKKERKREKKKEKREKEKREKGLSEIRKDERK